MDVKGLIAQLRDLDQNAEVRVDHEYGYRDADVWTVDPASDGGEAFVCITVR